jgi:glycosyltransferase involved in cell wall biosynthesis
MIVLSVFCFSVFLFGLAGMTVAPPLIARWLVFTQRRARAKRSSPMDEQSKEAGLEILIPVHNQAEDLAATLGSLRGAGHTGKIIVGVNACTDNSEEIAESFGATIVKRQEPGKWPMLMDLARTSQAEWVGFVDAGTLFSPETYRGLKLEHASALTVAVAPRYHPSRAGRLSKLHWAVEAFLKTLENSAGGPIAIHGAAVCYRRQPLLETLATLEHRSWVNDDVVIPLALRARNPEFRIAYQPHLMVDDHGVQKPSPERRRRLVRGNLQWLIFLRELGATDSPLLLLLVARRVFRLFVAWWLTFALLGALLGLAAWHPVAGFTVLVNIFALILILRKTELFSAFAASLFFLREIKATGEKPTTRALLHW